MAKIVTKMYVPADLCSVSYGGVSLDIEEDDKGRRYVDVPASAIQELKSHGLTEEPQGLSEVRKIEKDAIKEELDRVEKPAGKAKPKAKKKPKLEFRSKAA